MSTTMHDVAKRAGVSIKTVSNVLNDYPYVRPATRERVMSAVAELGYQMNVSARNLRQGRTGMIGLALPELNQAYFAELADEIIETADARGYTVLIEQTGARRDREVDVLGSVRRRMTDGVLFSPLALGQEDAELFSVGYPLVLLGEQVFHTPNHHVTMKNVRGARAAAEHLIERGRREIALLGVQPENPRGSSRLRLMGYQQALEKAGLPYRPELLAAGLRWHRQDGMESMAALLDAGERPDAVFGMNDAVAIGALHELSRRGIRVPDDIAVIGFDNTEDAQYSLPTLSTIDPGRPEIARLAVDILIDQIEHGGRYGTPETHLVRYEVIERESTRER